jgi:hypothetical protein
MLPFLPLQNMEKRKLSLILKRKVEEVKVPDLEQFLGSSSTLATQLNLHTKIQLSSLIRGMLDVKDLKKVLNYLTKNSGFCVFLVSKDHLFYSGSDSHSDLTTYNKLNLFRFSLKEIQIKKLKNFMKANESESDSKKGFAQHIDTYKIEDSLILATKLSNSSLYLGFLGPFDMELSSEFEAVISLLDYLGNNETFNERIARIFN